MGKTIIAFGDNHIPNHNPVATEILKKTIARVKPDIALCLGDMLDCSQFSAHPPTYGTIDTDYGDDLRAANDLIDFVQQHTKERTIIVEGNHEHRIDRWAANNKEGRAVYNLLAPRIQLMKNRKNCTYIPYGSVDGKYPHYKVNSRIVAVHGWSYAKHATKEHLRISQGKSVIHGHTHRCDASIFPCVWGKGTIQARSAGCMCMPIPTYGTGNPVEWVNAFIIGHLGKRSDTMFTVDIKGDFAILPDGTEISA